MSPWILSKSAGARTHHFNTVLGSRRGSAGVFTLETFRRRTEAEGLAAGLRLLGLGSQRQLLLADLRILEALTSQVFDIAYARGSADSLVAAKPGFAPSLGTALYRS